MKGKFKVHKMYSKTGAVRTVKSMKEHNDLVKKGYSENKKQRMDTPINEITDFDSIINSTLEDIKELILVKSKEYIRNDNPLHNFESASKISGKHPLEVLDGFLLNHEVSIKDITSDKVKGLDVSAKQVHEKIDDNIIYLLIKKVMLLSK